MHKALFVPPWAPASPGCRLGLIFRRSQLYSLQHDHSRAEWIMPGIPGPPAALKKFPSRHRQELPVFPCFHPKMMKGRCCCAPLVAPAPEDVGLPGQDLGSSGQLRIPQGLIPVSWSDCQGEQGEGQESRAIWDVKVQFTPSRHLEGSRPCRG